MYMRVFDMQNFHITLVQLYIWETKKHQNPSYLKVSTFSLLLNIAI